MKSAKVVVVGITILAIGFFIVYSQTGLPEGEEKPETAVAGYGAGVPSPVTPMLPYVSLPLQPNEDIIPKGANPSLLVEPSELEKNIGKWIIVDCRPKSLYDAGHIPTAIHLGETCNDFFRDDLEIEGIGTIPDAALGSLERLVQRLGDAGITTDKTILFYDSAKPAEDAPGRYGIMVGFTFVPFWYMEWLGHKDVRVLNGGIDAWIAEGKALETKTNKLPPSVFKPDLQMQRLATTEEVLKIAKGEEKAQLVDTRIPDEYLCVVKAPPGSPLVEKIRRAGHIPGTLLNVPHTFQLQNPPQDVRLRPYYQLNRLYQALDKDKRTIFYCVTATRAALSYFVARLLGFKDPALYHDSWIVWGNDETLPVECP